MPPSTAGGSHPTPAESEQEHFMALKRLLQKLRESQPSFLDEDVVHPQAEITPPHSPPKNDHHLDVHNGMKHSILDATRPQSPTSRSGGGGGGDDDDVVCIMDMVDHFEAKQLWRTRRSVSEFVRILHRFMAFVMATRGPSSNNGGSSAVATTTSTMTAASNGRLSVSVGFPSKHLHEQRGHANAASTGVSPLFAALAVHATPPGSSAPPPPPKHHRRSGGSAMEDRLHHVPGMNPPPSPASTRCLKMLDEAIQSLLVYANESEPLRAVLSSDRSLVLDMCRVCLCARSQEAASGESTNTSNNHHQRKRGSVSLKDKDAHRHHHHHHHRRRQVCLRSVDEVFALQAWLTTQSVIPVICQSLVDVYALELLLDAALPPSVCSSRFDGVASMLWERKASITTEMLSSRTFVASWMKKAPIQQVLRLAVMGLYALPKNRTRLYDKLTSEGILTLLYDHLQRIVDALRGADANSTTPLAPSSSSPTSATVKVVPSTEHRPGVSENIVLLHDVIDLLLCLTSVGETTSAGVTAAAGGVGGPGDGTLLDAADTSGRARSSSRGTTVSLKSGGWTSQVSLLGHVCRLLCATLNITYNDAAPVGAHVGESSVTNPSGAGRSVGAEQPTDAAELSASNRTTPRMDAQTLLQHTRRPHWVTAALVEKVCELLLQVAHGSTELLGAVAHVLDDLFDQIACHAVPLLLPVVLGIASAAAGGDDDSRVRSSCPIITEMIGDWFSAALSYDLVPWLFLNRRPWSLGRILSTIRTDAYPSLGNLALVRHVRRDEERFVRPFLSFAKRLVRETSWRSGTNMFLKKVLLLARSIVQQQSNRPLNRRSLIAGMAADCIATIAPEVDKPQQGETSLLRTVMRGNSGGRVKRERSQEAPSTTLKASDAPSELHVSALAPFASTTSLPATPLSPPPKVQLTTTPSPLLNTPPPTPRALFSELSDSSRRDLSGDLSPSPQGGTAAWGFRKQ